MTEIAMPVENALPPAPTGLRRAARKIPWTLVPSALWFGIFLLVPLFIVAIYSFAIRGPYGGVVFQFSAANYLRAADWLYMKILLSSVMLALGTTFSCLLIAYPLAYVMATSLPRSRALLLMLVMLPFWTNFVVRVYAIKVLLGEYAVGPFAVWLGMTTNYLPFMVLPLYVSLERFDFTLLEAARDLGASGWNTLTRVLLPQTRAGIVTGCVFVFTPALGEFVIPDILGGAKIMLMGNLITEQFLKTRDWPFGSALSFLMMAIVTISTLFYLRASPDSGGKLGRGGH